MALYETFWLQDWWLKEVMPISLSNTVDFFCADKDICMQICMVKEKTDQKLALRAIFRTKLTS